MKHVTKRFIDRSNKLSLEFDDYLVKHPELFKKIPDGAVVIVTLKYDKKFSEYSIEIVKKSLVKEPIVKAEKYKSQWTIQPLELATA